MAQTVINQVAWDYANIEYAIDIVAQFGQDIQPLVTNIPLGPAIREISYDTKLEFDDMYGSSRLPQDTTDGMGNFEASWTLEKYGADALVDIINGIDGHGIATVRFNIGVTFYKPNLDMHKDTIFLARVVNPSNAFKSGKDTAAVQMSLKPLRIFYGNKDPFGGSIV